MGKTKQQKVKDFLINNGVIIVMFILVIYTGLTSNNFFTGNNLMNILMNMSSRLVIALGIAGCVITAGCDLSAGRMIGFGACVSGMLLQRLDYSGKFFPDMKPLNVVLVAIIAMLICAAFGTVTGIFIAYLNVPPFIATLAMMEIVYGIGLIVTNATPLGGYVEAYTNVANGKFLGINYLIWIAIVVAAITWFIYVCDRWQPTGSRSCRCSCKENIDLNLHESSSYVWSCRIHARRKSRWCICSDRIWLRDGSNRSMYDRWCIRNRWSW